MSWDRFSYTKHFPDKTQDKYGHIPSRRSTIKPKTNKGWTRASEVLQAVTEGGRLVRRKSCDTDPNWLAVSYKFLRLGYG